MSKLFVNNSLGSLHPLSAWLFKGCRMGRSDKVSLWYVSLLITLDFAFFYFRISNC